MKTLSFLIVSILFLGLLNSCQAACSLSTSQLKAVRLAAAREWVDRVNYDLPHFVTVMEKYLNESVGATIIDFVGTFGPRIIAIEYGQLIFSGDVSLSFGKIYDASVKWLDINTLYYQMPYGVKNDFYGNSTAFTYTASMQNAVETEVLQFDPASCEVPKILRSTIIEDLGTRALSEAVGRAQTTSIPSICYAIQYLACPEGSAYQQYTSIEDCIGFLAGGVPSSAVRGLCPQPYSSKTLLCALVHLASAFIDPEHHCPHVGKNSAPCQDTCLTPCSSCATLTAAPYPLADPTTNAFCDTDYQNIINPGWKCKCLDSTVSRDDLSPVAGRTYCQPITCRVNKDCPVKSGTATCVSGKCVPAYGFVWNSSRVAQAKKDMSQCPYGTDRIFPKNGALYCVKPGYCLPQSITPLTCGIAWDELRKVSCEAIDTQDYGIPADIPKRMWGCVCNDGYQGGLGYPCVCPAPKVERFSLRQLQWVCVNPPTSQTWSSDSDSDFAEIDDQ